MKIGDFFVALGVDADQQAINEFSDSVDGLKEGFEALKVAAVATAIQLFTQSTIDATVAVQNFSNQTGIAKESLREFLIAAELADISATAEEVMGSLSALQDQIVQITRFGEGNIAAFQILGIDPRGQNALQVVEQLRSVITGLDNATAANLIQQLGLSPNFINLLRLSREEFEALYGNKTLLSGEQEKRIIDLGTAYTSFTISLGSFRDQVVSFIAPALELLVNLFTSLFDGISALIKTLNSLLLPSFQRIGVFFERAAQSLEKVTNGFLSAESAGQALSIILGAMFFQFTRLRALGPLLARAFTPLVALFRRIFLPLTALFLLIDDLVVFLTGGKSVIGVAITAFSKMADAIKESLSGIWDDFLNNIQSIGDFFQENIIGPLDRLFSKGLTGGILNSLGKSLIPSAGALASASSVFQNVFNINTSSSPEETAFAISDIMERQLNNTQQSINNGPLN